MGRSIIVGSAAMLLTTAKAVAQPAPSGHQPGEESAVLSDLVNIDEGWRVSNSMWTVEPDACTELRPAAAPQLRPAG